MSLLTIFLLAVALGMDCFVVSFSQGLIYKSDKIKNSLLLALSMGFFQWLMPFIGYFGTSSIVSFIEPFSKWIIFIIFFILGIKFIIESFEEKQQEALCIDLKCLICLGIATSIDALASGVSIKLTYTSIIFSTFIIGVMSFFLSLSGFFIANYFKKIPSKCLEITGGLILIGLAVDALF